jgi:Flp pilus assembly protein TadD
LAAVLAFSNSFDSAFVLDDIPAIVENPNVRSLSPLSQALDAPAESTVSGRPTVSLTFALNYALSTREEPPVPYPFHIGNLLIHILAALTLYGVIRRTLQTPVLDERFGRYAILLAAAIALLWVVHPLQTASVTYIVQRAEALMGLFLLLTLYCAIRAHGDRRRMWTVLAVLSCALGMGSKEVMVVAPLLVIAWDWFFARVTTPNSQLPTAKEINVLRSRRSLYAGLAATWVVLALNVWSEARPGSVGFGFDEWPWWRYLATQAGVILHYLRLAVVPSPLVLDYGWPPVESLVRAAPAVIGLSALLALTIFGVIRRHPASFLGLVFFLVLAPSSSVLPIVTEVAAEHRMYVPLASVIALVVLGGFVIFERRRIPLTAGAVVVAVAAGVLGWLAYERNKNYASEERIWADTIRKRPDNPRARINYGVVLLEKGRTSEAEPHMRKAVALAPDDDEALLGLGALLCSTGRCDEGLPHLRRAVAIDPQDANAVRNLAEASAAAGNRREAAVHFRRAVELLPGDAFVLNQAAWLLATAPEDDVRDGETALRFAERAVKLTARGDPVSLDSLAVAYAELGRWDEARVAIRQALAVARAGALGAQLREHQEAIEARRPVR